MKNDNVVIYQYLLEQDDLPATVAEFVDEMGQLEEFINRAENDDEMITIENIYDAIKEGNNIKGVTFMG